MRSMRIQLIVLLAALLVAGSALGDLRPEDLLIVVDSRNPDSLEVGLRYAEKRGVPDKNIVRLSYGKRRERTDWDDFKENIFDPVTEYIKRHKLQQRINMIVLTKGIPYSVEGEAATWMFYAHGVRLRKMNPYFGSRQPLEARYHFGPDRYPAVMLTGFTREDAFRMIDNGIRSDATHPDGTVYFMRGGPIRGLRYEQAPPVAAELELMGIKCELLPGRGIEDRSDVLGYLTGATSVKTRNDYLPGAFAEHLTSYGGQIYRRKGGQMSILRFIEAGATGTCGTVDEPLANWRKFPHARFYVAYARGFTLGEAMWQSVAMPYQVIFVGEPLACPFRRKGPEIEVVSIEPRGADTLQVKVRATAGEAGHRLEGVLMRVDKGLPRPVFPPVDSDTRVRLEFPIRLNSSAEAEKRPPNGIVFQTILKKDEPPGVALERLADEINATATFPVKVKSSGGMLQMLYLPNSAIPPYFHVRCEAVGGGMPAWLPSEPVCRFRGQSGPRPAMTRFHVLGQVKVAFEAGIRVGDLERRISVEVGETATDVLRAIADSFFGEERISGPDGIQFVVKEAEPVRAEIAVRSRKPGPEWNGREVRLHIPPGKGLKVVPYERKTKLIGGSGATPGAYLLTLTPNPHRAEKEIVLTVGEERFAFSSPGNETRGEMVARFCKELRAAAPGLAVEYANGRIALKSGLEEPPTLVVEKDTEDFSVAILGGRWAKLRSFTPEEGGNPPRLQSKWVAFLNLHVGWRRIERTVELDISALPPGRHDIVVHGFYGGPYRGVTSGKGFFGKEKRKDEG